MRSIDIAGVGITIALAAAAGTGASHLLPTASAAHVEPARKAPSQPDVGNMLLQGLRDTPGCLAADAANWESGKNSIVGWFESKQAIIVWYDSQVHRRLMEPMGGASDEPLAHIPDDQGPILVIASITFSETPQIQGFPAPISQISIELFAPLPGGAHINGRLAPEGFQVEHMRNLAPTQQP